jgi:hypothetical protein
MRPGGGAGHKPASAPADHPHMVYVAGLVLLIWSAASLLVLALCAAAARGDRLDRATRRTAEVQARLRRVPEPVAFETAMIEHLEAGRGVTVVRRPARHCAPAGRVAAPPLPARR